MEAAAGTLTAAPGGQDGVGTSGGMESSEGKARLGVGCSSPGEGPRRQGRGAEGAEWGRAEPGSRGRGRGGGSLSLTCMPGAAARQLRALGAARGWGVERACGARGMVGGFGR